MRPRQTFARAVPALLALAAVAGGACGSFGSAPDPGGDSGTSSPGVACTPPEGPSCALGSCKQQTLYVPDAPASPFAIVTDSAYVYWLEQRRVETNDDPYNGHGTARVLRTTRAGAATAKVDVLAAGQRLATGLALVPPHLYWATSDGTRARLSRVTAACAAPCMPEQVADYDARLPRLVGAGRSALFGLTENGTVVRFPIDANSTVGNVDSPFRTGDLPGIAVTGAHVYGSSLKVARVARATLDGSEVSSMWAPLSLTGGGDLGLTSLATDCTDLFGSHGAGVLERVALATGKVSSVATLNKDVYDLGADGKYVYVAAPNSGGVLAVDTKTNVVTQIAEGSAFQLAVDSAGVYWGDHTQGRGGKITMLVK